MACSEAILMNSRIEREREHAKKILATNEANWGWKSPAGKIRRQRRADYLIAATAGPKALELGCGTGTFTGELAQAFADLTSIDVAEDLLERAQKNFPTVKFANVDIHKTFFADGQFDIVLGCSVLHHLELHTALREIFRILRPGGVVRLCEPNMLSPQIFLQKNWPWLKRKLGDSPDETAFTPAQLKRSLAAVGFTDIEATPFEFLHPAIPERMIALVMRLEAFLEKTPLRQIGGSIKISARKPANDKRSA